MSAASEVIKQFLPWLEQTARIAHLPVVTEGHGEANGSRFNGAPFLTDGEAWPACGCCRKPMPLFLQLNLDELPDDCAGRFGSGLLQLFYCTDKCEQLADAWAPFDHTTKLVRIVPRGVAGAIAMPQAVNLSAKPATIVSWNSGPELPNCEEAAKHGIERSVETKLFGFYRVRFVAPALSIDTGWLDSKLSAQVDDQIFAQAPGDKLGGWPYWVQGVEYPNCTSCGEQMQFVFQIDSDDHVPHMFGDGGCGHITQCPTHKDVVTFAWACH